MVKQFYKHKLLLDENLYYRREYPQLNQHFDVKHIKGDLNYGNMKDPDIHELARKQNRIILTRNVKDFRPLLRPDTPGVIGIPETWTPDQIDRKLTALLKKHTSVYFRGRYRSLAVSE